MNLTNTNIENCTMVLPSEAICRAVFPFFVAASTIAPLFKSSWAISICPSLAARWRAFNPFWKKVHLKYLYCENISWCDSVHRYIQFKYMCLNIYGNYHIGYRHFFVASAVIRHYRLMCIWRIFIIIVFLYWLFKQ